MGDHWSVKVERNGEPLVTIESNSLSGRDLSPEDEDAIRAAAHHLLAFIGDPSARTWDEPNELNDAYARGVQILGVTE